MSLRKNASLAAVANHARRLAEEAESERDAWALTTRQYQGLDGGTWNSEEFHRAQRHRDIARQHAAELRELADHLVRLTS